MAEHFNIAVMFLGEKIPLESRPNVLWAFTKAYAPFFNHIDEICLNNYMNGTSECKKWPAGESLLKENLGDEELLFVYGESLNQSTGFRSSVHIEESNFGTLFLVSLPLLLNLNSSKIEQYLLETMGIVERFSQSYIVAAGDELEGEISGKFEDVLQAYFADSSLCSYRIVIGSRTISSGDKSVPAQAERSQVQAGGR